MAVWIIEQCISLSPSCRAQDDFSRIPKPRSPLFAERYKRLPGICRRMDMSSSASRDLDAAKRLQQPWSDYWKVFPGVRLAHFLLHTTFAHFNDELSAAGLSE